MKAVIVRDFTNFDQAEVGEVPDPTPGASEVVVDLEASETNFPDILYIEGKYQKKPPFPFFRAWRGWLVIVGFASGQIPRIAGNELLVKNISVSGIQWTDYRAKQLDRVKAAQDPIFGLCSAGKLSPRI